MIDFLDSDNKVLKTKSAGYNPNNVIREVTEPIPEGTVKIKFYEGSYTFRIYEITSSN